MAIDASQGHVRAGFYEVAWMERKAVHLVPLGYSSHVVYSRKGFDKWVKDGMFVVTDGSAL